jgi:hypothetical protein
MKWYWKVRLYHPTHRYVTTWIGTDRVLNDIGVIQDFYLNLTGCKMLLLGMQEEKPLGPGASLNEMFKTLWVDPK